MCAAQMQVRPKREAFPCGLRQGAASDSVHLTLLATQFNNILSLEPPLQCLCNVPDEAKLGVWFKGQHIFSSASAPKEHRGDRIKAWREKQKSAYRVQLPEAKVLAQAADAGNTRYWT